MMEREGVSEGSLKLLGLMLNTKQHKKAGLSPAAPNKMTIASVRYTYTVCKTTGVMYENQIEDY